VERRRGGKSLLTLCVYGPSGSGKTTQVGDLAKWLYDKTGKTTRLVSASGGGWAPIQYLVNAGVIEPVYLIGRQHPYEAISKLSKGYWPVDPDAAETKLAEPGTQNNDISNVGLWAFESMSEISDWLMRYSVGMEAAGKMKISAQKAAAKFKDGDSWFGSPAQAHYGTIQNTISEVVANSTALPGYVLWTALERETMEDRQLFQGPLICGEAKTTSCPAWFNNVLHLVFISVGTTVTLERRMYIQQHMDLARRICLAKNTIPFVPGLEKPEYLGGEDLSLGKFMDLLEESSSKAEGLLKGPRRKK
jgi:hypothetical protein